MQDGRGRNFGLDLLRCLAIVLVLANHAFLGFFVALGGVPWAGRKAFVSILSFISIEWLFVLSGFLIGAMMIRSFEREPTWWRRARSFWLRRWFRTLPNYSLFLVVNVVLVAAGIHVDAGFTWKHMFFAQNLAWKEDLPLFFNEAWSLALDEWFYLVLPLLVGAAARVVGASTRIAFTLATFVLIATPTLLRLTMQLPEDTYEWDLSVRRVTVMHLDATGWGVLAAITSRWHPGFWTRAVAAKAVAGGLLMAAGLLALAEMFFGSAFPATLGWHFFTAVPRFSYAFLLTFMGVGTFLAFPWIASCRSPGHAARGHVETLSNYTYSIYLSHFPVMYVLAHELPKEVPLWMLWVETGLWLGLTLAVSAAIHHTFEKPVSDLRERYTRPVDASPFQQAPGAAPTTAPPRQV